LKGKTYNMRISAKERESRSKERKAIALKLAIWLRREKDPDALADPEKAQFARQEQAKLRKTLRILDRGVAKQRAWADGKLVY
jgi:hypothetical protein